MLGASKTRWWWWWWRTWCWFDTFWSIMQDYIKITQAALRNSPFTQATHKLQCSAFRNGQAMSIFSLTYQKAMMVRLNNWIVSKKLEMHMKEESQTKCKFFLKLVAGARLQSPQTPKDISLASFFIKCSFLSPLWPTWNTTIFFLIEMSV